MKDKIIGALIEVIISIPSISHGRTISKGDFSYGLGYACGSTSLFRSDLIVGLLYLLSDSAWAYSNVEYGIGTLKVYFNFNF